MNMTSVRALCPVTCGCNSLAAPPASYFAKPMWGCPEACDEQLESPFGAPGENDRALPCIDSTPEQFYKDMIMIKYFRGAQAHFTSDTSVVLRMKTVLDAHHHEFGIPKSMIERLLLVFAQGSIFNNSLHGRWQLYPGIPHPRGKKGCDFWASREITLLLSLDVCSHSSLFRSLRAYCPIACGCKQHPRAIECPRSCSR
mmetsp:Transcript_47404/g.101479  ORF Transcript_47404/g.101479 Transcript_47404/m.101479 type:complete len:199 (+) Transcript_47404:1-597(+)